MFKEEKVKGEEKTSDEIVYRNMVTTAEQRPDFMFVMKETSESQGGAYILRTQKIPREKILIGFLSAFFGTYGIHLLPVEQLNQSLLVELQNFTDEAMLIAFEYIKEMKKRELIDHDTKNGKVSEMIENLRRKGGYFT